MKTCSNCHIEKPLDDFYTDTRTKDERFNQCKVCIRAYRHKQRLQKEKGNCLYCSIPLTGMLHKTKFCTPEHQDKYHWQQQKADPNYKEYHREKAREWWRKNMMSPSKT